MFKKIVFAVSLIIAFSMCAFAGEGSDTVGACNMLPQLRYGYSVSSWETTDFLPITNWDFTEHSYYAQLNWGVLDNLDLILLVGGQGLRMDSEMDIRISPPPSGVTMRQHFESDRVLMFTWGIGAKGTFYRADNGFYVGAGALFTHSISHKYSMTDTIVLDWDNPSATDISLDLVYDNIFRTNLYQLTADVHAGWHVKSIGLTPYVGFEYTWARMLTSVEISDNIDYAQERRWGMYAGVDYFLNDKIYINVEGRTDFADGWGLETGVGYLFSICEKPAPTPEPAPAPVIEPKLEPMSFK